MVNLRAIDLNLFVAFDALLTERNVTRAARRIGLSQPAMSSALGRLRVMFKDPLLVRTANGMQATARAMELAAEIAGVLDKARRLFDSRVEFDPLTSRQSFTVRMGDMNEFIFLPRIVAELRVRAPGLTLEIKHLSPESTLDALESDGVELALSTGLQHASLQRTDLVPDQMVLALRKGHPFMTVKDKAKGFMDLQHIRVSQSPADTRFLDDYLARRNLRRQVVVTLPHWLAAPAVVAQTDLVTVVSARMVHELDRRLTTLPLPFGPQRFMWMLYWHRRHEANPGHRWLRGLIQRVALGLERPLPGAVVPA